MPLLESPTEQWANPITHSVVCRHAVYSQTSKAVCIRIITIQGACCNLWCVSPSQSPRRSARRAIEKHLHYGPWLWQSVFTMQTECELNIPDLVKLGRSESAALGTKISVSSLQCARPSVMQLSRHASDSPLLSSTSKHAAGIKSLTLIGKQEHVGQDMKQLFANALGPIFFA